MRQVQGHLLVDSALILRAISEELAAVVLTSSAHYAKFVLGRLSRLNNFEQLARSLILGNLLPTPGKYGVTELEVPLIVDKITNTRQRKLDDRRYRS